MVKEANSDYITGIAVGVAVATSVWAKYQVGFENREPHLPLDDILSRVSRFSGISGKQLGQAIIEASNQLVEFDRLHDEEVIT